MADPLADHHKPCPSKKCNPIPNHEGKASPAVREMCKVFQMTDEYLQKYQDLFLDNIQRGLKKETHPSSIVKCFPTYVQDLPDGTEKGKFLALDLGGTNFRVLLVELDGMKCDIQNKIFVIPHSIFTGTGSQLMDHIVDCMGIFIKEFHLENETLPLGFTFSFPLMQTGLCNGILERWTKGFDCTEIIGHDVVDMLNEAIQRRPDVNIDICAILNDTTGTLIACAWKHHDCRIGLIVGTGTNACYVEKQKNAELFDAKDNGSGNVIINLESGAFGDDGCLEYMRTEFDIECDRHVPHGGHQLHEKMISGMYMGELVRLVIMKAVSQGQMLGGQASEALNTRDKFETEYVSKIESDAPDSFANTKSICDELGLQHATTQDYYDIRYICECVSKRAAHMCAASMVTLMHKMGEKSISIGIDGSVYRYHPHFHNVLVAKMAQLAQPGYNFNVYLSEDGSGRGAALIAAVANKYAKANPIVQGKSGDQSVILTSEEKSPRSSTQKPHRESFLDRTYPHGTVD